MGLVLHQVHWPFEEVPMTLQEVENNLSMVVACPYCSKQYVTIDEDGERQDYPSLCKRCGGPMNYDDLNQFADAEAMRESMPALRREKKA